MGLGLDRPITEICLLVEDVDRSIAFYEKIGFRLSRRGDHFRFASFDAAGIKLAVWERKYVAEHVGLAAADPKSPGHKALIAFQVKNADDVDSAYEELIAADVAIIEPPRIFGAWNSYCFYFSDPDGNAWEVYSWGDGGPESPWPKLVS